MNAKTENSKPTQTDASQFEALVSRARSRNLQIHESVTPETARLARECSAKFFPGKSFSVSDKTCRELDDFPKELATSPRARVTPGNAGPKGKVIARLTVDKDLGMLVCERYTIIGHVSGPVRQQSDVGVYSEWRTGIYTIYE